MSRAPKNKAAVFLAAMTPDNDASPATAAVPRDNGTTQPRAASRSGLKHVGAYLDRATVEKVAILRARLDLDNSELIRLAIDELYAKQEAKRAFGDA